MHLLEECTLTMGVSNMVLHQEADIIAIENEIRINILNYWST